MRGGESKGVEGEGKGEERGELVGVVKDSTMATQQGVSTLWVCPEIMMSTSSCRWV